MTLRRQNGFTLVELILASFMLSITMGAFYSVYRVQTRSLKSQDDRLEAQQAARSVLDFMIREMRNAGYNPHNTNSGVNCDDNAPGTPGIIAASRTSFHFSNDADNDGHCDTIGENENIKYEYNATTDDVTRTADWGSANITDGNLTAMQFLYYPQQTTGVAPAPFCFSPNNPDPCGGGLVADNLANIKRVSVQVTIASKNINDINNFGGGQLITTLTSNVDLRNR